MAAGILDTYTLTGLKEDVQDLVSVISPEQTPVYSLLRQGSCDREQHEWLTITLPTAADDAHLESTAWSYSDLTAETRLKNVTQIFIRTWRVSGTVDRVSKYGRGREWDFRRILAMKAFKVNVEYELLDNTATAALASGTARTMKGIPGASLDGGVEASANGSGGATSARVPLDEVMLNSMLQKMWLQGTRPDHLIVNGFVKRSIAGFVGAGAGRPIVSQSGERVASNVVDVYDSDFGRLDIVMSRYINPGSMVYAIQNDFLSLCWLRPPTSEAPPKDGDYFPGVLYGECTFEYLNPNAVARLSRVLSA